jgi:hypothetical protein
MTSENGVVRRARSKGRQQHVVAIIAVLSLTTTLFAVTPMATPPASAATPIRVRMMSFNIQYGAYYSTIRAVVSAIERSGADVVALQEPYGKTRRIARMLGGWYFSPRLHVISRYPIVIPAEAHVPGNAGGSIPEGLWGYLLLDDGAVAVVAQTHTPWWPNGMSRMRRGLPEDRVLFGERKKLTWLQPHLDATAGPLAAGLPTFFLGDLNSPSHLDWTPEAVAALGWQPPTVSPYPEGERYAIDWPVTVAMEDAGFRDSFREARPDPVAEPGFTHCVRRFCSRSSLWNRIDYVFSAGPTLTLRSVVMGEGGPFSDRISRPWPSDHRAVISTFALSPMQPAPFAAPIRERVATGGTVNVAFDHPSEADREIGLWSLGADPASDPALASSPVDDALDHGVAPVDSQGLDPGMYKVALLDGGGDVVGSSTVALVDRDAPVTISTSQAVYAQGDPVEISWAGGRGNRYDWLGLYRAGCQDPERCSLPLWRYVDGRVHGAASFLDSSDGAWPIEPGRYVVHLCVDDDYRCIATTDVFRVVAI